MYGWHQCLCNWSFLEGILWLLILFYCIVSTFNELKEVDCIHGLTYLSSCVFFHGTNKIFVVRVLVKRNSQIIICDAPHLNRKGVGDMVVSLKDKFAHPILSVVFHNLTYIMLLRVMFLDTTKFWDQFRWKSSHCFYLDLMKAIEFIN